MAAPVNFPAIKPDQPGWHVLLSQGFNGSHQPFTFAGQGYRVATDSALGFVPDCDGDDLTWVGHPPLGHEADFYDRMARRASASGKPVMLIGLSRGGQVMNGVFRHLWAMGCRDVILVPVSTPPSLSALQPRYRRIVRASRLIPVAAGGMVARLVGARLAADPVVAMRAQGEWDRAQLIEDDAKASSGIIAALRALRAYRGFGPPLAEAAGQVVPVNLLPWYDDIVDVDEAYRQTEQAYPRFNDRWWEALGDAYGHGHGNVARDPALYRGIFSEIRREYAPRFNLPL